MPLPAIGTLCRAIDAVPPSICISMPGGGNICAQAASLPPSLFQLAMGAMGQVNSALTPLTPLFDVIEAVNAVVECIKAIPKALGPPPDPSKLVDCLPELVKRLEKILLLLPPASVLLTIAELIDLLITIISGTQQELDAIAALLVRITQAQELAPSATALLQLIDCAHTSSQVEMANIERAFAAINPIIDLINDIGALAGLKPIPPFGGVGADPAAAGILLGDLADGLRALRSAIPVPS